MNPRWNFLNTPQGNAYENMEMDLSMLYKSIETSSCPILRIYQWKPSAVSLGCNQNTDDVNIEFCKENNIDIVKRPTGGRAVFHQGDVTYSFVISSKLLKDGDSVNKSYKEISSALILGLKELGVNDVYIAESTIPYTKSKACMAISTGADLEYRGHKIAGSAQLRKNGYILQHGSILLNQDFELAAKILNVPVNSMNCINVVDILGVLPSYSLIAESIKRGFESKFAIKFC